MIFDYEFDLIAFLRKLFKRKKRPRTKKRFIISCLILLIYWTLLLMLLQKYYGDYINNVNQSIFAVLNIPDDTSCFSKDYGEDSFDGIGPHSIFLISASCKPGLSMQEACAIEAVSRANLGRNIYVLHNRPLKDCRCTEGLHEGLKSIPTVTFIRININKFVENTPLHGIFDREFYSYGLNRNERIAEILKFATLYRFGGVVLDLNTIVVKSVTYLGPNWVVKVNGTVLGSAAVGFDKEGLLSKQMLPLVLDNLMQQRHERVINGGKALTDSFRKLCYDQDSVGCSDLRIYDAKYFYPINETNSELYFKKGNLDPVAYGYYIWHSRHAIRRRGSIYLQLMNEYCPSALSYF